MSENKVTTPTQLKSLVEALDLMHEEDEWTPTPKQWNRIKEMIESLEERGPVAVHQNPAIPTPRAPGPNPAAGGTIAFPSVPVATDVPVGQLGPAGQSSLSAVSQPVAPAPDQAVQSSDGTLPEKPPASPGL